MHGVVSSLCSVGLMRNWGEEESKGTDWPAIAALPVFKDVHSSVAQLCSSVAIAALNDLHGSIAQLRNCASQNLQSPMM